MLWRRTVTGNIFVGWPQATDVRTDVKAIPLNLPGVCIVEPTVWRDARGFFYESFNANKFADVVGVNADFVQDNHSSSVRGVLRGIHYQLPPHAQGKLVRVVHGAVFDVAVDLRRSSATFGRWVGVELSAENMRQLWIPAGFGHGFLTLSERADFLYKTTDYYSPSHERCIRWDDPALAIQWPDIGTEMALSPKDLQGVGLADAEVGAL